MRALLFRDDMPAYLDPGAQEMLSRARKTAREAELDRRIFIQEGADVIWFTWTGTRIHGTLKAIGMYLGGFRIDERCGIALTFESATQEVVLHCYESALAAPPDATTLAKQFAYHAREKYEPYLSADLQRQLFGRNRLDVEGASEKLRSILPYRHQRL